MRALLTAILLLGLVPAVAPAQTVRLEGAPDDPAVELLETILARNDYRVLDRDTVIPAESTVARDVIVVDARVAVEGRIEGAVAVLGGDLFIRPGATVPGPIAALGGGAYPSGLATVGEVLESHPRIRGDLAFDGVDYTLRLSEPAGPGAIRVGPLLGVGLPTYDRVDGLKPAWSASLASRGDTSFVALVGSASYAVERERPGGSVAIVLRPAYRTLISASARRATETSERWIRDDLTNSLASLLVRSDIRDYYETDELSVTLARTPPPPIIEGEGYVVPSLTFRVSRDRSLAAGNPWSLTGSDDWRLNPAIDEGVLAAAVLGASGAWQGLTSSFAGDAAVEWAPGGVGDFEFAQIRATGAWQMTSLYRHVIAVTGHLRLPIGGSEAPLQRWSFVGGPETLPVHPDAALRGDHVAFVESTYLIPLNRVQLPVFGIPSLRLLHAAGVAWRTGDDMPPVQQNLGVGLQLMIFDFMAYVDPAADPLDPHLSIGARLPLGGLPF